MMLLSPKGSMAYVRSDTHRSQARDRMLGNKLSVGKPNRLTHGMSNTGTYLSWRGAKQRCTNPNAASYPRYGGRGIEICSRWIHSFANFLEDMGERPEGMSLDRINNDGNYEPSNCRWATPSEQNRNQRKGK